MEKEKKTAAEIPVDGDTYHRFDQLVRVAYHCRTLSWVILVIGILTPIVQLMGQAIAAGGALVTPNWSSIIPLFTRAVATGLYRFAVLQALSQILYLLLDIEYNTRNTPSTQEVSDE